MSKRINILVTFTFAALASGVGAHEPVYFGQSDLPFSEAVQVGDMLYLSGQIGTDPALGAEGSGGIEEQSHRVMDRIGTTLHKRGLDHSNIVKCTVMLIDMADWPAFNAVYVSYFQPGELPARSAFAASGLAMGSKLEVECWAHIPGKQN